MMWIFIHSVLLGVQIVGIWYFISAVLVYDKARRSLYKLEKDFKEIWVPKAIQEAALKLSIEKGYGPKTVEELIDNYS